MYYDTEEFNVKIRTALAPYWQNLVHLNCACSITIRYYYTRSRKSKWPGLVAKYQVRWTRIMVNARLHSRVRIKTRILGFDLLASIVASLVISRIVCIGTYSILFYVTSAHIRVFMRTLESNLKRSKLPWLSTISLDISRILPAILILSILCSSSVM